MGANAMIDNEKTLKALDRIESFVLEAKTDQELADILGWFLQINGGNEAVCKRIDQVYQVFIAKRKELVGAEESK
jgi:hypothetical protein